MSSPVVSIPSPPLATRLLGILTSPRRTFRLLLVDPQWAGMLCLTFAATAAARSTVMSTDVGRQALTDQWVRRAEAFGRIVTDELFAAFERLSDHAVAVAALTSVASGLLLAFVLAGILVLVFGSGSDPGDGPTQGGQFPRPSAYRRALAVVVHANVILTVRDLVAAPVDYLRESIGSPLTLGTFVPMLDEGSAVARFLSLIDFFIVWWLVALAIGTAVLYRRRARSLAVAYLGLYVAFALVMAAAMLLSGGGT